MICAPPICGINFFVAWVPCGCVNHSLAPLVQLMVELLLLLACAISGFSLRRLYCEDVRCIMLDRKKLADSR